MNNDLNNKKTKKRNRKNKPLLSATVDIVFKKLFIENPDLLSSLLESFLPLKSSIKNIEIKNPNITENLQPQSHKTPPESSTSEPQSHKTPPESSNSEPQAQKKPPESNINESPSQESSPKNNTAESQEQKHPTSQSSSPSSSKLEFAIEDSTIHPEKPNLKMVIMDLRVKLSSGESINIEVQTSNQHGFTKRILFYLSKLFTEDLKKGEDFDDLKPAYSLIFTTFPLFDEFKQHLSTFSMIRETHPHVIFSESMRIILVELSKFKKSMNILFDLADFWCYFLLKVGENLTKEEKAFLLKNKDTKMALEHLEKISQNENLRERALAREKNWLAYHLDQQGLLKQGMEKGLKKGIKKGREEGLKEGLQKGIQKGLQKGIQEGIQKGIQEGREEGMEKKQKAIALKMIKRNYSSSEIAEIVECPEDEIKKLMK